jgi:predicted amidohydrolase YtcJ
MAKLRYLFMMNLLSFCPSLVYAEVWSGFPHDGATFVVNFGSEMLRVGGLKGFSDGSLGSTTALFYEPYRDDPATSGIPGDEMFPEGAMLDRVREADPAVCV